MGTHIRIRHWLPIVTFCPVNRLPDLIYISVTFSNEFQELYQVRRRIKKVAQWKLMFMEDIANTVLSEFPTAKAVHLNLLFNRHSVTKIRN
jgi:hypothetical protein